MTLRRMENNVKVSVLVPIYGVERYIERCARSLFEQTIKDGIEFIFTDDCSPDNSIEILKKVLEIYPDRERQVKIISHETNKGLVAARATGLNVACGEYIIHCDSDDWVDPEMYESMYHVAIETGSDMVICDFMEGDENSEVYRCQKIPAEKADIFTAIINGTLHSAMWNKLVSRKLIDRVGVRVNPEISMWEDMAYMTPFFLSECRIFKIDKAYYHYRCVSLSMSRILSLKSVQSQIKAVESISEYIEHNTQLRDMRPILDLLKIKSKDYYLVMGETYNPGLWRKTFPCSHRNIFTKPIPIMKKILYFMCEYRLDLIVRFLASMRKNYS